MMPMPFTRFGLVAAIGIAGAFLLGRVLQRRLDAMTSTTEAIVAGDMSRRMALTGADDEFDRLSTTLDRMLERIAGQAGVDLLDNALRHTPAGANIAISLAERDGWIAFAVSDRGPGIAPEDRARVFSRFTRLESSRSTPGHGLGLSLVAAVARAHGGTVSVHDNQPGATFMLSLPKPR